jgi:antitoxin MazE
MMNLQIAKWGNSLAVRLPAAYMRQIGMKEGDKLEVHLSVDGALNLRPSQWSRKAFAKELLQTREKLPKGSSVMEMLRSEARY